MEGKMRSKTISGIFVVLVLFTAACRKTDAPGAGAGAETVAAECDRACLEGYVNRYLDAMLEHEATPELFAPGCRFTENGVQLPLGEGLWASMVGKGTYEFYVPDVVTQQVAFIGTAREEAPRNQPPSSVALALRLKVRDGLITEAEQLVIRPESNLLDPGRPPSPSAADAIEKLGSPHPVYAEEIPEAGRPSREEMIQTANAYFTGMQKNDGKGYYPFTDDCHRIENGNPATNVPLAPGQEMPDPRTSTVYSSHWGCKQQFESGLIYFVTRIRDRRFVAVDQERGVVFSFCFFDHAAGKSRYFKTPDGRDVVEGPTEPWTWQVAELFKVENGLIRRIEAVLQRSPYGMNSGWSTYEQGMSDEIQVIR
jgi:hypothetical protein